MIPAIQGLDIYLLDQILKERFDKGDRILDAGCGGGRNMVWFAANGFNIEGCDRSSDALSHARGATGIDPSLLKQAFLESLPYPNKSFNDIICSAVLHFAQSETHFKMMIAELVRVLKPEGILFIRMTSDFGLSKNYAALGEGRYLLADGSERFLLTKELLSEIKEVFHLSQIEPVKSTLVEDLRSMTTLVLMKMY
jgi:ubiquinone/menaquinone biosynthesis C-methylase UbiE